MIRKTTAFACLTIALSTLTLASQAGAPKSADQVKAVATATKTDAKGTQTVTITLDIVKGWHLYANPVNHNNDFLDGAQTRVKVAAKEKVKASVKYPVGKTHVDGKEKYDIYEGKVTIQVGVQRTAGDVSPLEIVIDVQACDSKFCLMPSKIKLQIP